MVVFSPDALAINGKHGSNSGARKCFPGIALRRVNLSIFTLPRTGVCTTNGKHAVVAQSYGCLITPSHQQVWSLGEAVRGWVIEAVLLGVRAALDEDATIFQSTDAGAKHVMTLRK